MNDFEDKEREQAAALPERVTWEEMGPELLAWLIAITPDVPDIDARCHYGIVPQDKCAHCTRMAALHGVIERARKIP